MDNLVAFAGVFGAVSGGISLITLLVIVGVYKDRIDRHERYFNLLVDESLMRAWRSGAVDRGSFKSKPEVISTFPSRLLDICEKVAAGCKSGDSNYAKVSELILKASQLNLFSKEKDCGPYSVHATSPLSPLFNFRALNDARRGHWVSNSRQSPL